MLHALHRDAAPAGAAGAAAGAAKLNVLWRALGVTQHHDAVTGTALPFVYVDYRARLANGIEEAQQVVSGLLGETRLCTEVAACANTNNTESPAQPHCVEPGVPTCPGVPFDASGTFDVTVINPLAWNRGDIVTFALGSPLAFSAVSVIDSGGAAVASQLGSVAGATTVSFRADGVPALGSRVYRVTLAHAGVAGAVAVADRGGGVGKPQRAATATAGVQTGIGMELENSYLRLDFDASGRLKKVTNKDRAPPLVLNVSLGFRWYWASTANDDGAYDFHVDAGHPGARAFPGDVPTAGAATLRSGPVYDEVVLLVDTGSNIELITRLYHDPRPGNGGASNNISPHFEVFATVGPVDLLAGAGAMNGTGKDIVLQINTSIVSAGRFYTDSSGMELMARRRGQGTFNNSIDPAKPMLPGDNFYPTTAIGSIRDAATQLVWISDRSMGCGSTTDGSLEKMVYRRLVVGDGKGMSVPLNSTDTVRSKHKFVFAPPIAATEQMRPLYWKTLYPLAAAVTTKGGLRRPGGPLPPLPPLPAAIAPMLQPLPSNIHLLTLQTLENDWEVPTPFDIPSPYRWKGIPICGTGPVDQKECGHYVTPGKNITQALCRNLQCCYRPGGFPPSGHVCIYPDANTSAFPKHNAKFPPNDPTALADGTTIIRLHNIYAAGESELARPSVVDLAGLFRGFDVGTLTELSLSAAQDLANLTRVSWPLRDGAATTGDPRSDCTVDRTSQTGKFLATIRPMDVCTYALRLVRKPD